MLYGPKAIWRIARLASDLTVFMLTEGEVRKFSRDKCGSVGIVEEAGSLGPEYVIMDLKDGSRMVFDRFSRRRWVVPTYGVNMVDPTGMRDAFDGGFLFNYRKTYDVVKGALCGQISAGFCAEGSGPAYLLDCLPGLKEARVEVLRSRVIAV